MDPVQTNSDDVRAPVRDGCTSAVASRNLSPIERYCDIELCPGLCHGHRSAQVKANLQWLSHATVPEERFAAMELLGGAVGQARVEPNVVLVVGETPEGDAQLQLLWHGRKDVLHQFEGDVGGHAASGQLREGCYCRLGACKNRDGFIGVRTTRRQFESDLPLSSVRVLVRSPMRSPEMFPRRAPPPEEPPLEFDVPKEIPMKVFDPFAAFPGAPLPPFVVDVGFLQPRQLLHILSGSELQVQMESSSKRSESSKLKWSHSSPAPPPPPPPPATATAAAAATAALLFHCWITIGGCCGPPWFLPWLLLLLAVLPPPPPPPPAPEPVWFASVVNNKLSSLRPPFVSLDGNQHDRGRE